LAAGDQPTSTAGLPQLASAMAAVSQERATPPFTARRPSRAGRLFLGAGRTIVALASVAVLLVTWYAWAYVRDFNNGITRTDVLGNNTPGAVAPQAAGGSSVAPLDSAVNILVVGMDSRTDPSGNPLPASELAMLSAGPDEGELDTDTMILIHIPAGGQRAVAISFPRDSWVQLAGGYGMGRLNSAFAFAHNTKAGQLRAQGQTDPAAIERQADDAGRSNLINTIEQLIGNSVQINEYAELNLVGFYNLSQAVGGVQVCLKAPTYDDETHAHFPAGVQTISGVQALDFVRERHGLPRGDLDRIVRQQVFIGALANKILSANTLASPSKLESLIQAVQGSVVLSTGWDITTFAQQMSGLTSGNIQFATIPTGNNFTTSGGAAVTAVSPSKVQQFVSSMVSSADNGTPFTDTPTDTSTETVTPSTPPGKGGSIGAPTTSPSSDAAGGDGVITANGTPCVN
ncbi:MAG TPA: LCP family protein, partial [Pseudonocardiaceae bacterium]|nr:LCP family protein [Pseudonocardiaceae bacterium]